MRCSPSGSLVILTPHASRFKTTAILPQWTKNSHRTGLDQRRPRRGLQGTKDTGLEEWFRGAIAAPACA